MNEQTDSLYIKELIGEEDSSVEQSLRPDGFVSFVGQESIKNNLKMAVVSAKKRSASLDHLLLYGPPGLGKTSLAYVLAKEMEIGIKTAAGPALTKAGDIAALLTGLQPHDILFVDEIHRLPKMVEEILYPAMEDRCLDIMIGKGPSARSVRIDLQPFTLIGATTRAGMLSNPLRDRFGMIHRLEYYSDLELQEILTRSANLLGVSIDEFALELITKSARKTPRIANKLLKRVRDYAIYKNCTNIDLITAQKALNELEIDELGLNRNDRFILTTIHDQFRNGPVGLDTLAAATGEESQTLEDLVEPFLMRIGFIDRTSRGRVLTLNALQYFGWDNI